MTKSNFVMLKNIRTITELVCSELTGNEHSKVTNLMREKNQRIFNLRNFGKKGC